MNTCRRKVSVVTSVFENVPEVDELSGHKKWDGPIGTGIGAPPFLDAIINPTTAIYLLPFKK
jgi:hypothetical protein